MKNIVIVGGGFAGVWAAMSAAAERNRQGLSAQEMAITLISKDPALVIRPRLYQGAKEEMRVPLSPLLAAIDVGFRVAEVSNIDPSTKMLNLQNNDGDQNLSWDSLILATGSQLRKLPIPGALQYGFDNDSYEGAARLDKHLGNLDKDSCEASSTFVVVGAGFTGIETATELRGQFGKSARIVLLDQAADVGEGLGDSARPIINSTLASCSIEVKTGISVTSLDAQGLTLESGEVIKTSTVIFATGLEASPLTRCFDTPLDETGRLAVNEFLKLDDFPSVFVAGDVARAMTDDQHVSMMSCQHALKLGQHAGHNAVRDLTNKAMRKYQQERYVTCMDLGPMGAVFTTGWEREVSKTGEEAKTLKRNINEKLIYPPPPEAGEAAIYDFIAFDPQVQST